MAVLSLCLLEALLIVLLIANLVKRWRAERSLRENKERLTLAMAAADVGVWVWDIPRNEVWASANWRRMFGFPLDAAIRFENVIQQVHAEDRVALERALRRAVEALKLVRLLPGIPARMTRAPGTRAASANLENPSGGRSGSPD